MPARPVPAALLAELETLPPVRRDAVWLARVRLDVGPHPTARQVADALLWHSHRH